MNDHWVNIPSYQVKPGDVVAIAEKSRGQLRIQAALQLSGQRGEIDWVEVHSEKFEGTFKRLPDREELPAAARLCVRRRPELLKGKHHAARRDAQGE